MNDIGLGGVVDAVPDRGHQKSLKENPGFFGAAFFQVWFRPFRVVDVQNVHVPNAGGCERLAGAQSVRAFQFLAVVRDGHREPAHQTFHCMPKIFCVALVIVEGFGLFPDFESAQAQAGADDRLRQRFDRQVVEGQGAGGVE